MKTDAPDNSNTEHFENLQNRFIAIVQSSDDAIISKNLDGIIQSWNSGAQRIFGYTAEEAIGKPVLMLMPPERENEEPGIIQRIRKGERIDHYETVRRRKDGSLVDISLTVSPIKDATGTVVGASKIARDITERKRTEALQRRLSAIVEYSDDAIISKDLNGVIQSWNSGAQKMFGYTASEAIGQSVTLLMPEHLKIEEPGILKRIRAGERIDHYETVRQRKDGTLIDVSLGISPIKGSQGDVIGASKIVRDITERVGIQKELEQAKRELAATNCELEKRVKDRTVALKEAVSQMEEFSYTVSHDLRSPVRAIKGYATAVLETHLGRLDQKGIEYLQRIVRCSLRMDKLIRDVLVYSRLSAAKPAVVETNVEKLISETLLNYPEFQPSRISVTIRSPLLPVMAEETSLMQALANLLGNAVKFVAPGAAPKVEIWTERRADRIQLWIKDNGIGIKPEHQARIFEVFERAHQDQHYDGTGIGLAIARKSVEKIGGTMGLESDGATGCSFWIDLAAPLD